MPPDAIEKLEAALRSWGGTYQSETYDGALHGWMIAGGKAYHPEHAERGFAKLMELLDNTLRAPAPRSGLSRAVQGTFFQREGVRAHRLPSKVTS